MKNQINKFYLKVLRQGFFEFQVGPFNEMDAPYMEQVQKLLEEKFTTKEQYEVKIHTENY